MTSPDYKQIIDLSLYDKNPSDIADTAQALLRSRIPDWSPASTNVEVMLIEAMALEVSETIFSLNRLPQTMIYALLAMYGVDKYPGTAPECDFVFWAYDSGGYTIPEGTEVALQLPSGEFLSFYTEADSEIDIGDTSVIITAVAREYTSAANGIPASTQAVLVDAVAGIESVYTDTEITNGADPETMEAWAARGALILQRLVDTLVLAPHFTAAALGDPLVYRATTYDDYEPGVGFSPGHVTVIVYGTGGVLTTPQKAAIQADLADRAQANLIVDVIDPTLVDIPVTASVIVKVGYVAGDVQTAIETALGQYLNPLSWLWGEPVRPNELISLIDQVPGVSYVESLTFPATTITLGTEALANPGTFTITAT